MQERNWIKKKILSKRLEKTSKPKREDLLSAANKLKKGPLPSFPTEHKLLEKKPLLV